MKNSNKIKNERNLIIEKYSNENEFPQNRFYPVPESVIKPSEISIRRECSSGSYVEPDGCFYYPESNSFVKIITEVN